MAVAASTNLAFIDSVSAHETFGQDDTCAGLLEWCVPLEGVTSLSGPVFKYGSGANLFSVQAESRICHCYVRKAMADKDAGLSLAFGIRKVSEILQAKLILVIHTSGGKVQGKPSAHGVASYNIHKSFLVEATAEIGVHIAVPFRLRGLLASGGASSSSSNSSKRGGVSAAPSTLRTVLGGVTGQSDLGTRRFRSLQEFNEWTATIHIAVPTPGFRLDAAKLNQLDKAASKAFKVVQLPDGLGSQVSDFSVVDALGGSLDPITEIDDEAASHGPATLMSLAKKVEELKCARRAKRVNNVFGREYSGRRSLVMPSALQGIPNLRTTSMKVPREESATHE